MTRLLIENSNLENETTHLADASPVPAFKEWIWLFTSPDSFNERNFCKEGQENHLLSMDLLKFSNVQYMHSHLYFTNYF